jgi:hypothetical protein
MSSHDGYPFNNNNICEWNRYPMPFICFRNTAGRTEFMYLGNKCV